jgi:hypothetical protein
MSNGVLDVMSMTTVHRELEQLARELPIRKSREPLGRRYPFHGRLGVCLSNHLHVAAALNISLEEEQSKRRPVISESRTPLGYDDVQYNRLSEERQHDPS